MMPIVNGKTIAEEEFNKLDANTKKEYEDKSTIVQQHIMEAIGEIKSIERESDKRVQEWQSNVALLTINGHINLIKAKFKDGILEITVPKNEDKNTSKKTIMIEE